MGEPSACDCVQRYDRLCCLWTCALCGRHITDEQLYRRGLHVTQEAVSTDG